MNGIPTVIFDFDGTLVDSFAPGLRIVNRVAPEFGFRSVAPHEVDKCRDMSPMELVRFLEVPVHKLPLIVRRIRNDIKTDIPAIRVVNGISDCLQTLADAGVPLGIVTSNARDNVRQCLELNGVFSFFEFLHSSINLFGKHRTLRRVMKKRKIPTESAIYVGDETRDIQAARKRGIRVIGVDWGLQSRQQLQHAGPDLLASHPMEIAEYVLSGAGLVFDVTQHAV